MTVDVQLGTELVIQGISFRCVEITHVEATKISQVSSETVKRENETHWPYRYYAETSIEDFAAGDTIRTEYERLQLLRTAQERKGDEPDLLLVFTYYRAVKEKKDGNAGLESGDRQAAGAEAQSSREGDPSLESARTSTPSEDSDPVHRS